MRRKVLLIAVIGVVFLGIAAIFVRGHGNSPSKTQTTSTEICTQLIRYVENSDAKNAYELFSTHLKSMIGYSDWQNQMHGMTVAFGRNTPTFIEQLPNNTGDTSKQAFERRYTMDNYGTTYNVACYVIATDTTNKTFVVDGFGMQRVN